LFVKPSVCYIEGALYIYFFYSKTNGNGLDRFVISRCSLYWRLIVAIRRGTYMYISNELHSWE